MKNNNIYDDKFDIDLSDIPEITDFSKAIKNPYAGKFTNGYTVIVEHEDYNEIIKVKKTRKRKPARNMQSTSAKKAL